MSRQLPKTREEAFAYQFEDDVKILYLMSSSKEDFKKHLAVLQARIDAYNKMSDSLDKTLPITE